MVVELRKRDCSAGVNRYLDGSHKGRGEEWKGGTYDNLSGDCLSHKVLRTPTEGLAYPKSGYNTSNNGSVFLLQY